MRSEIRSRENNSVRRRSDGFKQAAAAHDVQILVDGEARCGKDSGSRAHLIGAQSGGFGEFQPALDSAFVVRGCVSIVIDDALAPGAAKQRIGSARQDDRVLDRDDALVVVAVQSPGLQLSAAEAAFVHQQMKRMLVVIAFFADSAELGAQFVE